MRPYSRVYASVNLDAAAENMRAMRESLPPGTAMMGVVKADGYGHGAVPIAKAIDRYAAGYGTATADEAFILRRHGITKPILVLGPVHASRYEELVRGHICPAIFRMEEAEKLSETALKLGEEAGVHLAVDTGMCRIGMRPNRESAEMVLAMSCLPGLRLEGLFTHFARADERDKTSYEAQLQAYRDFVEYLRALGVSIPLKHCSNSAAILDGLDSNGLNMVRAGIALYGLYPSDEVDKNRVRLRPVMELKSAVTYIKDVEPGAAVSYGGTFVADRPMRVATIPVGYGDGYPRSLSNRGDVLIRGKRARILGRICMDQFMADVTAIPEAREDDAVTLLGRDGEEEITAGEIAQRSGGFHYELVCGIGKRVPRVYVSGEKIIGTKDYFDDVYKGFC